MVIQRQEVPPLLANAAETQWTENGWQVHRHCRPLREPRLSRWASWYRPSRAVQPKQPAGSQARSLR
jgi:hypothetical protein